MDVTGRQTLLAPEASAAEEAAIGDAGRIRQILDEPVVRKVLEAMRSKYLAEWKDGKTVEDREVAHKKAVVLDDFVQECVRIIDAGKRASIEKDTREKEAKAQAAAQARTARR